MLFIKNSTFSRRCTGTKLRLISAVAPHQILQYHASPLLNPPQKIQLFALILTLTPYLTLPMDLPLFSRVYLYKTIFLFVQLFKHRQRIVTDSNF